MNIADTLFTPVAKLYLAVVALSHTSNAEIDRHLLLMVVYNRPLLIIVLKFTLVISFSAKTTLCDGTVTLMEVHEFLLMDTFPAELTT